MNRIPQSANLPKRSLKRVLWYRLKLGFWMVIGIILTLIALLHIPSVQHRIVTKVTAQLSQAIQRDITIEHFQFSLLGTLDIRGAVIANDPRFGNEPMGSIDQIFCVFDPLALLQKKFRIRHLYIKNPVFRLAFDKDKDSNVYCGRKRHKSDKQNNGDDRIIRRVFDTIRMDYIHIKGIRFEFDYEPSDFHLVVPFLNFTGEYRPNRQEIHVTALGSSVETTIENRLQTVADLFIEGDIWGDGVHRSMISVTTTSGETAIHGSCSLTNFKRPELEFSANLRLSLEQMTESLFLNTPFAGELFVKTCGTGPATDLHIVGSAFGQHFDIDRLALESIQCSIEYIDQMFHFPQINGSAYNGILEGSGSIFVGHDRKGLDLQAVASQVDISKLFEEQQLPLLIPLDAQISAQVKSASFVPETIEVSGIFGGQEEIPVISKRNAPPIKDTPLTISGEYVIKGKNVIIPYAKVENNGIHLEFVRGLIHSDDLSGEIYGYSSDVSNVTNRLAHYLIEPIQFPALKGMINVSGSLGGTPRDYEVSFQAMMPEILYGDSVLTHIQTAGFVTSRTVSIDDIVLQGASGEMDGYLSFQRRLPPQKGYQLESGQVSYTDIDLKELGELIGLKMEMEGTAEGRVVIGSPGSGNHESSHMEITDFRLAKIPLGIVSGDYDLSAQGLSDIRVVAYPQSGRIMAEGDISFHGPMDWRLDGEGIDLAILNQAQPIPLHGIADIRAGCIPATKPVRADFVVTTSDLIIRDDATGPAEIAGTIVFDTFPSVTWNGLIAGARIQTSGQTILYHDYPTHVFADISELPINTLIAASPLYPWNERIRGEIDGIVHVDWDIRNIDSLVVKSDIRSMEMMVEGYQINLRNPTTLIVNSSRINIQDIHLDSPDIQAVLDGFIDFKGDLNLTLTGQSRIERLERFTSFMKNPKGQIRFDIALQGPASDPNINGTLKVQEFYSKIPVFNLWLEDFHGQIDFHHKLASVRYFEGNAGGSLLTVTGECGMRRYLPELMDLKIHSNKIEFEFPEDFKSEGNIDIKLLGDMAAPLLEGNIDIIRTHYHSRINYKTLIISESRAKLSLKNREIVSMPGPVPIFNPKLQISILAPDNVRIDNNLAKMEMKVELVVQGDLHHPKLFGRIEAIEGRIIYQGRQFDLERATIDFIDPDRINPRIDALAAAEIGDYRVGLEVIGAIFSDLDVHPYSTPALSDPDLWSLLLIGKTREQSTTDSEDYLASGVAYVTGSIQDELEKRFKYWMGFDEFSIDPIFSKTDESPSAKFTVKKSFGPNLTVLYSRAAAATGDILMIEYKISDNLYLVGQKNEENAVGGSVRFRWEFR